MKKKFKIRNIFFNYSINRNNPEKHTQTIFVLFYMASIGFFWLIVFFCVNFFSCCKLFGDICHSNRQEMMMDDNTFTLRVFIFLLQNVLLVHMIDDRRKTGNAAKHKNLKGMKKVYEMVLLIPYKNCHTTINHSRLS